MWTYRRVGMGNSLSVRRKVVQAADALGLSVEVCPTVDRMDDVGPSVIAVSGPDAVYGPRGPFHNARPDPNGGDRRHCRDWVEALERVREYRDDLVLHYAGIDGARSASLLTVLASDPTGRAVFLRWLEAPEDAAPLGVLADRLDELGFESLAPVVRRARFAGFPDPHGPARPQRSRDRRSSR